MGSSGGNDPRANRRCASDMAEKNRGKGTVSSKKEEEKPRQMQGLRGYWSSSRRGKSTVGGSLLSLHVTDQEKRLRDTVILTRPVSQLAFYHIKLISNVN